MIHRISIFLVLSFLLGISARATLYGTIRGVVHDQKHRPIADAEVVLKAEGSDYSRTAHTDESGEFIFDAVALGDYSIIPLRYPKSVSPPSNRQPRFSQGPRRSST